MSFDEFLDRVDDRWGSTEITVYAPEPVPEVADRFEHRAVTTAYRRLPSIDSEGFLVVRTDDTFRVSIGLDLLWEFLEPPIFRPWDEEILDAGYAYLLEVLDNTLAYSLERRQLLATAREIENRAWRIGSGTLRVGFQRFSAFERQLSVYDRLARETNLDIHVFARDQWVSPVATSVTVHPQSAAEIREFWFLAYDGGDDPHGSCALLAKERDSDEFVGFWTYDSEFVAEICAYVRDTYDS